MSVRLRFPRRPPARECSGLPVRALILSRAFFAHRACHPHPRQAGCSLARAGAARARAGRFCQGVGHAGGSVETRSRFGVRRAVVVGGA